MRRSSSAYSGRSKASITACRIGDISAFVDRLLSIAKAVDSHQSSGGVCTSVPRQSNRTARYVFEVMVRAFSRRPDR
jgi:hypothetical protein